MACNGSSCQSNCHQNDDETLTTTNSTSSTANTLLCVKCKSNEPISGGGGEDGNFCGDCFRSNLFTKFRHAVTSNAMISPTDKVLVAFSGGSASRVALQFVHDMQCRAQKNYDASRDRSLPVFGVGVAFVDESIVSSVSLDVMEGVIRDLKSIVADLCPPTKELHIFPIERIFSGCTGLTDEKEKMKKLLNAVGDPTGKEDFLVHLRMLSLQKIALENGYNRIVMGSCTSRIASHVISATVKGQGYSLPADIQYVDARSEIPVVLPLRDCLARELDRLCHFDRIYLSSDERLMSSWQGRLKTVQLPKEPSSTINSLISSFVALLQEENPSRECTIVRTAGKLTPFHFNKIPDISDSNVPLAMRRRQKRSNQKLCVSISSELFCPICSSPLASSDLPTSGGIETSETISESICSASCSSCRFQILPQDSEHMESFCSLLPMPLIARAKSSVSSDSNPLRAQIEDCLLSDSESDS